MVWYAIGWFFAKLILAVGISYLLAPKPKTPDEPTAAGLDQFQLPTALVGREFSVLFGHKKLTSQNIVWYGDLGIEEITEKVSSGLFSSTKVTTGYKYSLGIHMVLAHDLDKVFRIAVDGKTAWSGESTGGRIDVNATSLFGGEKQGGGLSGAIDFETGASDQSPNDYLQSQLGDDIPAFRGVSCFVLRQFYFGTSEYIKPWEVWVQKIYDGWYSSKAQIGSDGDMNPAHIIRETIVNDLWGMGYNDADIDDTAFSNVADTLYDEGFGLSILWDHSSSIENFLSDVLKHIDASLFTDIHTGKFTLKLIRDDYNTNDIPVFDEDNIVQVERFKRRTLEDITNSVTIKFWNRESGKEGSITRADIAMVARMHGTNNTTIEYKGIANKELAEFVLSRDLRGLSTPLASATLMTTREGMQFAPGDPFLFSWPQYSIEEVVMRVTDIEYGEFGDSNIRVECVEDVFAVAEASYSAPPASGWVSPTSDPDPCPVHAAIETPYYNIARKLGQTEVDKLADDVGYASVVGGKPSGDALNAEVYFRLSDEDYGLEETKRFAPYALLTTDIAITDTNISISWQRGENQVEIGMWGIIDYEIVRIDSISIDSVTIGRGCLDTVPVEHSEDTELILLSDFLATENTRYSDGDEVNAKMCPTTPKGTLDLDDAPEQSITMNSRLIRPYPPARFRINDEADSESDENSEIIGDLALEWRHRNRTEQLDEDIHDTEDDINIGPESGTEYTFEVRQQDNDNLLHSESNITGTTADATSEEIDFDGWIELILWSERDGYESWQKHERELLYLRQHPRETENGTRRVTEVGGDEYRIVEG